jgi:hypothetical protein
MNKVTKINVDVQLIGSEADFFNNLLKDKCPKEFVELIFRTGFAYLQGTSIGIMMHEKLGNMQIPVVDKPSLEIYIDRVFFDDKPVSFSIDKNEEVCYINGHSIYMLRDNKAIKWKKND